MAAPIFPNTPIVYFQSNQTIVDAKDISGQFILTRSQTFLLLQKVSQSLAGRCAVLHLLPFSPSEIRNASRCLSALWVRKLPGKNRSIDAKLSSVLMRGFYPRIHDKSLDPVNWLGNWSSSA
jgi:predicted AAA+ superfamily ATPase